MKKTFLAGLVTLLPLAVTFYVVTLVIRFLTNPFMGFLSPMLDHSHSRVVLYLVSQVFILLSLFLFTLGLGFFATRFFFTHLIQWGDILLKKIPLMGQIYKTSKEIVQSLFSTSQQSFKQVVLLSFPYPGAYCLGLIAHTAPDTAAAALQEDLLTVFIPTAPNPMTGYLLICKKKDLLFLKMKSEEAIKYVVSCGVITPTEEVQK